MQSETFLTTPEASERSGYSATYLSLLLRRGVLAGFRRGRDWFVYVDSLEQFLATPRKSGPKGPRSRSVPEELGKTSEKMPIDCPDISR